MEPVAPVNGADVTALTAQPADNAVLLVTELARGYTRGRGFWPDGAPGADVAAVIVVAAARLAANTGQTPATAGGLTIGVGWSGWSLAEQMVLNRYRARAQ